MSSCREWASRVTGDNSTRSSTLRGNDSGSRGVSTITEVGMRTGSVGGRSGSSGFTAAVCGTGAGMGLSLGAVGTGVAAAQNGPAGNAAGGLCWGEAGGSGCVRSGGGGGADASGGGGGGGGKVENDVKEKWGGFTVHSSRIPSPDQLISIVCGARLGAKRIRGFRVRKQCWVSGSGEPGNFDQGQGLSSSQNSDECPVAEDCAHPPGQSGKSPPGYLRGVCATPSAASAIGPQIRKLRGPSI